MKTKGIYFLFRVLQAFGLPVVLLYFLFRGVRDRGYLGTLPERFGFLPGSLRQTGPGAIWLHAVSVGEVIACAELLRRLRSEFPRTALFVSTSTLAGRATAGQKLASLADGIFFAPVDYVFAVRRVLRTLRPSVVVVAETEIWPHLFRETRRTGAALALVNGRISDRAFPRYLRFRRFFAAVLPAANAVLVQTDEWRERFLALGAAPESTRTAGNFKYDFTAVPPDPQSPVPVLLARVRPAAVWIAASTMPPAASGEPDEDDTVIAAFAELASRHPGLFLILAPRKPERFDSAAEKLAGAGIRFVRRSLLPADDATPPPQALLLDTIGELSGVFALADVVFMGGTLPSRGGHNILEPAFFAKPVITGPHMENFQAIAEEFRAAGALVGIAGAEGLAGAVERLLGAPAERQAIGERALACAKARGGATARTVEEIRSLHLSHLPRYRPALPWYPVARLLSRVWAWGGRRGSETALRDQKKIDAPVVSVGNLTMGGTGKTPCVVRVVELMKERGMRPAILTRGYKRASPHKHLALAPGAPESPVQTGDEPQIFLRSGLAPVGVGADRYRTAMMLRREFDVDSVVLDDAFQHVRVTRDCDIVLLDALNPFGGSELFPLGRLREPLPALARADLFVVTRTDLSDNAPAIEHALRQWNSRAPIFRASLQAEAWVENKTGQRHPIEQPPFGLAAGFCGLGNPQAFLRTLRRLGVEPVVWNEFEDHHRYRPGQLRRLASQASAAGATALVTTEKDAINLCEESDQLLAPLPLYWLAVSLRIDREEEFLADLLALL